MKNDESKSTEETTKRSIKSKVKKENSRSVAKVKEFRLSAKNLFLTYSKAHHLEKESVLDQLKCLVAISDYIISEEKHQDGSRHVHVQLTCERKVSIYNVNYFDLIDAYGNYLHGHYKTVKNGTRDDVIRYVAKSGNYITNHDLNQDLSPADLNEKLMQDCLLYGIDYALKELLKRDPKQIRHLTVLKRSLKEYLNLMSSPTVTQKADPYPVESFKEIPVALNWKEKKKKTTLVLYGPPGTGKTEYAKALYPKALFVSNKEGLQSLNLNEHEAICYDDYNWINHNRDEILSLIDCSVEKDINVKYGSVRLYPNIPKMITLNKLDDLRSDEYPEIKRRLTVVHLKRNIYVQVININNLNINVNTK